MPCTPGPAAPTLHGSAVLSLLPSRPAPPRAAPPWRCRFVGEEYEGEGEEAVYAEEEQFDQEQQEYEGARAALRRQAGHSDLPP